MTARVSSRERLHLSNRAEVEIRRYADDHLLWHKHVHGIELDPMQLLKCMEMDAHPNTVDVSCRRTGKTAMKEWHALKNVATNPYHELGIVAPRMQQSQSNLRYHLEAIRRSQILRAYIAWKSGRERLNDTGYEFVNNSKAIAYGIMSQIDGDGIAYASIEEVDDMPSDRLFSRFLPMLGAARRAGAAAGTSFKPQIRLTGVFKGADTLTRFISSGQYHLLPIVNAYLGIELGILNQAFVEQMRAELPEGEYIRQFLCKNVSAQNHIWEKFIRQAMAVGLRARLEVAEPMPGERYRRRGLISFGYDHTGHGENPTASKSALTVAEQIGNYVTFPYVRTWPAGTDDKVIEMDLLGHWDYFRPDVAYGDAYGVGMLTSLNDRLYARGLTEIDRRTVLDGESTASSWAHWPFSPIRFEGMTKHSMAAALRSAFHNGQAAIPYFDDGVAALKATVSANVIWMPPNLSDIPAESSDWTLFVRQLNNIKATPTRASYASYTQADKKLGDDLFDSTCAAVWGLVTRGAEAVVPVIASRRQTREQLLGQARQLPEAA